MTANENNPTEENPTEEGAPIPPEDDPTLAEASENPAVPEEAPAAPVETPAATEGAEPPVEGAQPCPPTEGEEVQSIRLPVSLPVFSGPLDLLVHLITKRELDIFSISLSDITTEYLETLRGMEQKDLDMAGEYLVLAATLIRFKARSLLPKDEVEVEEEIISDEVLASRRREYERFRLLADELRTREELSSTIFPRQGKPPEWTYEVVEYEEVSIYDLHQTFQKIIEEIGTRPPDAVEGETYSVDEKMMEIEQLLENNERIAVKDYLRLLKTKLEIIVVFLAILEMIRLHEIKPTQSASRGDIILLKGERFKKRGEEELIQEDWEEWEEELNSPPPSALEKESELDGGENEASPDQESTSDKET